MSAPCDRAPQNSRHAWRHPKHLRMQTNFEQPETSTKTQKLGCKPTDHLKARPEDDSWDTQTKKSGQWSSREKTKRTRSTFLKTQRSALKINTEREDHELRPYNLEHAIPGEFLRQSHERTVRVDQVRATKKELARPGYSTTEPSDFTWPCKPTQR